MHLEHLQPLSSRYHRSHVEGVAVTEAGAVEHGAVVVKSGRAPHHLVATVAIDIADGEVVVAVAEHRPASSTGSGFLSAEVPDGLVARSVVVGERVTASRLAGAEPFLMEERAVEVDRPDEGVAIVATAEDAAGVAVGTVETSHGGEIALATVAIGASVVLVVHVAPVDSAGGLAAIFHIAIGVVEDGVKCLAGLPFEDGEVFLPTIDASATHHPTPGVRGVLDDIFRSRLVDIPSLSVEASRGRLAHQLGLAIAVEVIDHVLGVMRSGTDVPAQVDAPQPCAVEFVAVDIDIPGDAALGVVLGVGGVPFHK